jgi:hypothetical protein
MRELLASGRIDADCFPTSAERARNASSCVRTAVDLDFISANPHPFHELPTAVNDALRCPGA